MVGTILQPPIYSLVVEQPVATLNAAYRPPNRHTRRKVLFGTGGKPLRQRGLYEPQKTKDRMNEYGYRSMRSVKHTHVHPKTRVRVTLHDSNAFTDQYLRVEGKWHYFRDHGKVKSSTIYQVNKLTKSEEIQQAIDGNRKGPVDER